jgi:hypothetical protein
MKSTVIIVALAALAFTSCTSAYKTGQTPDDVYFSPTRGDGEEYVQTEKREDRRYQGTDEYYEDRYLRMRANDRYRWSVLDDYYMNSPYAYNYYGSYYGNSLNSPYNNYWSWNTYYNPYCNYYGGYYGGSPYYNNVIIIKNPTNRITPPSRPIAFNPASYGGGQGNINSRGVSNRYISSYSPTNSSSAPRYNNSNRSSNNSNFSNGLQKIFSNTNSSSGNNGSNNSSSTPSRSYTPSTTTTTSTNSSSSGSSGSSSSGASRPNR